ncbi:MAG: 23S rRNA (uracil(1939)-C(5))-methyltransferase RlmD [Calditrichaeota bacterium]|nr:MAG: 23S rRNA (uracil(1939)-C(5))-methyltransferase RlmD [Calditrichota bacterium]
MPNFLNQIHEIKIDSQEHFKGNGVGRIEDFVVFVNGAVEGDVVNAKITESKKTYGNAQITKIVKPSPHRIVPECEVYRKCGGCSFLQIDYDFQLETKEKFLKEALQKIGKFDLKNLSIEKIVCAEEPLFYRNKIIQPVGLEDGKLISGFYKQNSHKIVDFDKCYIQPEISNKIVNLVKSWASKSKTPIYNEEKKSGVLRSIFLRINREQTEVVVCLVTKGKKLPFWKTLLQELTDNFPQVVGLVQNFNSTDGNNVLSENFNTLWGRDYIFENLGKTKFKVSIGSFFQVNSAQTVLLYNLVKEFCNLSGTEKLLDVYCGLGSIGIYLADKAEEVVGVEVSSQAIKDADFNADLNELENCDFYCGKVEEVLPQLLEQEKHFEVVIVDPPRKGLSTETIEVISDFNPEKIIYVSCNPTTLARDLRLFTEKGFSIKKITPVDLFPQTHHCEAVCLLEK